MVCFSAPLVLNLFSMVAAIADADKYQAHGSELTSVQPFSSILQCLAQVRSCASARGASCPCGFKS